MTRPMIPVALPRRPYRRYRDYKKIRVALLVASKAVR